VTTYYEHYYPNSPSASWLDTCTLPESEHALCTVALNLFIAWDGDN
jgi:hypothetical protein